MLVAVGEPHPLDPVVALEAVDAGTETQVDAVLAVEVGEHHAHLGAEPPLERRRAAARPW